MNESSPAEAWLRTVVQRLSSDGFSVSYNVSFAGSEFVAVAHRSRFELTKLGNSETFFVFGDFQTCDADSVHRFSSLAFKYAKKSKSFPLPRGLFESVYWFCSLCSEGTRRIDGRLCAQRSTSEALGSRGDSGGL